MKIISGQDCAKEDNGTAEQIARFAEFDPVMTRREIISLPAKIAAAVIAAKIASLIPGTANATEYTPEGYAAEMWQELNPYQIETNDFQLLDSQGLPRPILYYMHNVRGKIEKQGVNIPTPSFVFELAKECWYICRDKVVNIEYRRKVLAHLKEVAAPGHRDYERIMKMYEQMTLVDKANKADWQPLVNKAKSLVTIVENMVMKEEAAAKSCKADSPVQDDIASVEKLIPMGKPVDHGDDFDNWEEVLPDTRPKYLFRFQCGKLPAYNDEERPQTDNLPTEAVLAFRNVAKVHFEAAVQRHKAYENMLAVAEIEPDKKLRADLKRIAHIQTNKPIRNGWGDLLSEEVSPKTHKKGAIIELAEEMIKAANNEMQRAYEINRCAPVNEPNEQDYIGKSIEELQKILSGKNPKAIEGETE